MVFAVDLHVHTQRYSPCAETLNPEALARVCRERGVDGVLLTEHDAMWSLDERDELQARAGGVKLFRGAEVTCREGHFLVTGIEDLTDISKGIPVAHLVELVTERGGVTLLAHPYRDGQNIDGSVVVEAIPLTIAGVEVKSSLPHEVRERYAETLASTYGWLPVAGSDAHAIENVGKALTIFPYPIDSEIEMVAALKAREGVSTLSLSRWMKR